MAERAGNLCLRQVVKAQKKKAGYREIAVPGAVVGKLFGRSEQICAIWIANAPGAPQKRNENRCNRQAGEQNPMYQSASGGSHRSPSPMGDAAPIRSPAAAGVRQRAGMSDAT